MTLNHRTNKVSLCSAITLEGQFNSLVALCFLTAEGRERERRMKNSETWRRKGKFRSFLLGLFEASQCSFHASTEREKWFDAKKQHRKWQTHSTPMRRSVGSLIWTVAFHLR